MIVLADKPSGNKGIGFPNISHGSVEAVTHILPLILAFIRRFQGFIISSL